MLNYLKDKIVNWRKRLRSFPLLIVLAFLLIAMPFAIDRIITGDWGFFSRVAPAGGEGAEPERVLGSTFYFGTFYDNFSNASNTDVPASSLYIDLMMNAVIFPPVYERSDYLAPTAAEREYFSGLHMNEFEPADASDSGYSDRYCLRGKCLEQAGLSLSYNNRRLALPVVTGEPVSAAIGLAGETWLVGITWRSGKYYFGQAYVFDGHQFAPILDKPVESEYFGRFGFGGETSDYLVIYGGHEGKAYRIRPGKSVDISEYFSYRAMGKGFKGEAIKAGDNWYVFSLTSSRLRLIKLWNDQSGEIAGALDLGQEVFSDTAAEATAFLQSAGDEPGLVIQERDGNGGINYFLLKDKGFDNASSKSLTTLPVIVSSEEGAIAIRRIVLSEIGPASDGEGISIQFEGSREGKVEDWKEVRLGKDMLFSTGLIDSYRLRMSFPVQADKNLSPFVPYLTFNYNYVR